MVLNLRADDLMPWGKYIGETIRDIYDDDPEYFEYLLKRKWQYKFSEKTIEILENHLDIEDCSKPTFSKGGCLGRTELFIDSVMDKPPFEGMSLEEVFFENESYYRSLVNHKDYYIDYKTYEILMKHKYGEDSVTRLSREQVNDAIIGKLNGFEFAEDEVYTDKDLIPYLGETISTVFSDETAKIIQKNIDDNEFELDEAIEDVMGPGAKYRTGQREAVLSVLNGKRTLVVQHTGWGKSLVYFMSIRKLREYGKGPAIIICPLLALMHNQIASTGRYQLNVKAIASDNMDDWADIYDDMENDEIDALIISPERLANDDFMKFLERYMDYISLFVVDEAHCISDWGHDFRPDFRRIIKVVKRLPKTTPVLATTATANDRVIKDIKKQLGDDLEITRGTMARKSIAIDVYELGSDHEKQLWLKNNIPKFKGVGIVYCLTIRACEEVVYYLRMNGINAEIYHSELSTEDKRDIENEFQRDEIKVLVATVAFGMGIDKPNIEFVIHYHQPANAISYYQQIGRAGREIKKAYAILLAGDEDNQINAYFIKNAFPTENEMNKVVKFITDHDGVSRKEIMDALLVGQKWADKVLKYLLVNGDICKKNHKYFKTKKAWKCDMTRARIVSWFRWDELRRFNEYIESDECYMNIMQRELNDTKIRKCGRCSNCLGRHLL